VLASWSGEPDGCLKKRLRKRKKEAKRVKFPYFSHPCSEGTRNSKLELRIVKRR